MRVARSDRSFVCDARTPLYHALTHDKMRKILMCCSVANAVPIKCRTVDLQYIIRNDSTRRT
ncbi:hypothetical protein T01_10252 [Trichinella spiralis]|uniref:Uncharacterized protein n=1 Tax=Trichinella spiralis TaxID=6334 RepID=A0A0V1BH76_TRISP|nr:hypothetical protein T01_10252 [Trichinella spiralis]